jgi:hypothetical protein
MTNSSTNAGRLGFGSAKTLLSTVDMELFTLLAKPSTVHALQGRLALQPISARDFLDALVALGFLERKAALITSLRRWTNSWTAHDFLSSCTLIRRA